MAEGSLERPVNRTRRAESGRMSDPPDGASVPQKVACVSRLRPLQHSARRLATNPLKTPRQSRDGYADHRGELANARWRSLVKTPSQVLVNCTIEFLMLPGSHLN